jgi:hypothetical protein
MRRHQRESYQRFSDPAAVAREVGYSPRHLQGLIKLGIKVRGGGNIDEPDLRLLREAHPAVSPDAVLERVRAINMTPAANRFEAFVQTITASSASDPAYQEAARLVDEYQKAEGHIALDARLDAKDAERERNRHFGAKVVKTADHIERADTSLRAELDRRLNGKAATTADALLHKSADAVERQIARAAENRIEGMPDDRRGDIAAAFDAAVGLEVGKEFGAIDEDTTLYHGVRE